MTLTLFWLVIFQGDEHQTVDGLLQSLELAKYAILFKAEEVSAILLKFLKKNYLASG